MLLDIIRQEKEDKEKGKVIERCEYIPLYKNILHALKLQKCETRGAEQMREVMG